MLMTTQTHAGLRTYYNYKYIQLEKRFEKQLSTCTIFEGKSDVMNLLFEIHYEIQPLFLTHLFLFKLFFCSFIVHFVLILFFI